MFLNNCYYCFKYTYDEQTALIAFYSIFLSCEFERVIIQQYSINISILGPKTKELAENSYQSYLNLRCVVVLVTLNNLKQEA